LPIRREKGRSQDQVSKKGGSTPERRTERSCDGREVAHSPRLRNGATVARMVRELALETDYLVVGSGALGMAFVDSLLEHSDADVVMVDRRHCPGGHWLDAYPFVRLHQPSRYYGVDSTVLGQDRIERDGPEAGWYERASGSEICGYYDELMSRRFLTSGQVRFFPMSNYLGERRFASLVAGTVTNVVVRKAVVDATYFATRVPATDPPPFDVAAGMRCVPVGELAALARAPAGYVILGGGKTAMDAICWLLDCVVIRTPSRGSAPATTGCSTATSSSPVAHAPSTGSSRCWRPWSLLRRSTRPTCCSRKRA